MRKKTVIFSPPTRPPAKPPRFDRRNPTDVFKDKISRPFEDLDELDQLEHDLIHARGDVDEVQHKFLDSFFLLVYLYLYWLVVVVVVVVVVGQKEFSMGSWC